MSCKQWIHHWNVHVWMFLINSYIDSVLKANLHKSDILAKIESDFVCYRPQMKFAKVIFFTLGEGGGGNGWYPSMHCRWYPNLPCSRSRGGRGGIPTCLAGFQAHTQGGSWGVWPGACIPACTEADTPNGYCCLNPTGMHSCNLYVYVTLSNRSSINPQCNWL